MMLRQLAMKSMAIRGARKDAITFYKNYLSGQGAAISSYLKRAEVRALKIGSGVAHDPTWLETDVSLANGLVYLDATKPFPIPTDSFSYVYAEHMIEHVPLQGAQAMLGECRRILKPGGVLRLATPDLSFLIGSHHNPDATQQEYVDWIASNFLEPGTPKKAPYVINLLMHAFGHQFIYDEETLAAELKFAGFSRIERVAYGESSHSMLRNVERHHDMMQGGEGDPASVKDRMVKAETMILEAS